MEKFAAITARSDSPSSSRVSIGRGMNSCSKSRSNTKYMLLPPCDDDAGADEADDDLLATLHFLADSPPDDPSNFELNDLVA